MPKSRSNAPKRKLSHFVYDCTRIGFPKVLMKLVIKFDLVLFCAASHCEFERFSSI